MLHDFTKSGALVGPDRARDAEFIRIHTQMTPGMCFVSVCMYACVRAEYFEAGSPGPSSRANSPFDILEHDNQTDDALGKRKFQNSDAGGSSLWNDSVTFPRLAPCGSSMYIDDSENLGTGSRDFADDTSHESTAIPLLSQVDPSSEAGTPPCARVAVPEGTTTQVNKERTLPAFQIQSSKPAVDQAADTDVQSNIIPLLSQVEPALEGNELPVSASDAAALGDGGGGEGGNGYLDIQSVDVREQERILQARIRFHSCSYQLFDTYPKSE